MSLADPLIDGAGNLIGFLAVTITTAATGLLRAVKRNRSEVTDLKQDLDYQDGTPQRLESIERDMGDIRESLARQERQHDRVESYLVGDEDTPHDSVFARLDKIEDKIDE